MANAGGCQETQGLLQVLAEGGLSATERSAVEAHLADCPACTAEGARLQDNAAFLKEALEPFRMPADLTAEFLLALPPKNQKRKAPPPAAAAPRTLVLGDTRARGSSPWKWIGGIAFLGAAGGLGWLFLSEPETTTRRGPAQMPGVGERPPVGQGPADGKKPDKPVVPSPAGKTGEGPAFPPPAAGPLRTAADLVAALRAAKGAGLTPTVRRGWDLLATNPAAAKETRELAAAEKDATLRAGLVACLGADGNEENRSALRGFLGDEGSDVRIAAALALGRSLSIDGQRKLLSSGKPLDLSVDVGPLPDDPARGEIAARLSVDPDAGVRKVLVAVLAATAPADPSIRDRLLEGVKGAFGEDLVEACVRALQGVKDPSVAAAFAEALSHPGTPKGIHGALLEGICAADEKVAAEKLAELLAGAQAPDLKKEILAAFVKVGGAAAQKAFVDTLAGDSDGSVRLAAVSSLGRYPSREVLDALTKAAENDADQAVRQEAERIAKGMKPGIERAEGGGAENPPGDNPNPAPAPDGN